MVSEGDTYTWHGGAPAVLTASGVSRGGRGVRGRCTRDPSPSEPFLVLGNKTELGSSVPMCVHSVPMTHSRVRGI